MTRGSFDPITILRSAICCLSSFSNGWWFRKRLSTTMIHLNIKTNPTKVVSSWNKLRRFKMRHKHHISLRKVGRIKNWGRYRWATLIQYIKRTNRDMGATDDLRLWCINKQITWNYSNPLIWLGREPCKPENIFLIQYFHVLFAFM